MCNMEIGIVLPILLSNFVFITNIYTLLYTYMLTL